MGILMLEGHLAQYPISRQGTRFRGQPYLRQLVFIVLFIHEQLTHMLRNQVSDKMDYVPVGLFSSSRETAFCAVAYARFWCVRCP